ncbi:DnaJ domain-containing protein [Enhydrobacter aerosaccus]|uniref:DnaJ domain-containing protein n=1 Tax=Enhydrobacter aerosaccus TaxID=225324 RepID=A0A1T4LV49_9HYPH|nr:GvpL/GvpF family gas vesicle protein [Enhydrobacter aerosaccus]SJZ58620.1 DnaJ domain-containing protein [Enhydrobacter aerosaccus]
MSLQDGSLGSTPPIYVYAIVPACPGVAEKFGSMSPGSRLDAISAGPFAAVIGDGVDVGEPGQTREQLAPRLLSHQRTIEQIMRASPLLPVKFGTLAPDEGSVRVILEKGKAAFQAAFDRLGACVQMELLVSWDLKKVLPELARDEAIASLKRKLEREGAADDQAARAELGKLVKSVLDGRRATLASSLLEQLRSAAEDVIAYPPTADQVVLHLVLLTRADGVQAFYQHLEALDAAYDGRLMFRCVGPSAPYSFATVEIQAVDPATLVQARRLLDVEQSATSDEVRAAYRRLARSLHPDLAGAGADDGARMAALTEAYQLLVANATFRRGDGEQSANARGGLAETTNATSIHVFVRRQESAFDGAR